MGFKCVLISVYPLGFYCYLISVDPMGFNCLLISVHPMGFYCLRISVNPMGFYCFLISVVPMGFICLLTSVNPMGFVVMMTRNRCGLFWRDEKSTALCTQCRGGAFLLITNAVSRPSISTELSVLGIRRATAQTSKPLGLIDGVRCTDGLIHLPNMVSFLVNVWVVGTEDFLTACKGFASRRTVICGPPVRFAAQDQDLTINRVLTAFFANIDCLPGDCLLVVLVLVSSIVCIFGSDGKEFRHIFGLSIFGCARHGSFFSLLAVRNACKNFGAEMLRYITLMMLMLRMLMIITKRKMQFGPSVAPKCGAVGESGSG